jgi:hypothetical protein
VSNSSANDYKLYLPVEDTQSDISIAVQAIPSVLGRNLHDYFEKNTKVLFGAGWINLLKPDNENERLNKRDFALLQKSWLWDNNSPLRTYMPTRHPDFVELSHRCLGHRNALAHNNGEFRARSMLVVVEDFRKFAETLKLELLHSLVELEKRMKDLAENKKIKKADVGMSLAEAQAIFETELAAAIQNEKEANEKKLQSLREENELQQKILLANKDEQEKYRLEIEYARKEQEKYANEIADLQAQVAAMVSVDSAKNNDSLVEVDLQINPQAHVWAPAPAVNDLLLIPGGSGFKAQHPGEDLVVNSILELGRLVDRVQQTENGGFLTRIQGKKVFVAALKNSSSVIFEKHNHGELKSPIGVQLPPLLRKSGTGKLTGFITNRMAQIKSINDRFSRSNRYIATNQGCLLGLVDGKWCCVGEYEIESN